MSETEELKTRIETIRALSDQLRERNRTVKSLEEEMTATAPEHAWSFGKKHHYNLLKAELEDERRLALEDKYRLGSSPKTCSKTSTSSPTRPPPPTPWNPCST